MKACIKSIIYGMTGSISIAIMFSATGIWDVIRTLPIWKLLLLISSLVLWGAIEKDAIMEKK